MGFDASFNHPVTFGIAASSDLRHRKGTKGALHGKDGKNTRNICQIQVLGMSCQSCVKNIETNVPLKMDDIISIKVSLEEKMATVVYFADTKESLMVDEKVLNSKAEAIAQLGNKYLPVIALPGSPGIS